MREALELARTVDLRADVNPHVGAVIVSANGDIVGRGWHEGAGSVHAEIMALEQSGDQAHGATLYCTLEPCNAHGKQPPCSQAILESGIAKVVFGQYDPNPTKSGGAHMLSTAGIDVESRLLEQESQTLNASWNFAHEHNRPWVMWKTATTLDGFIAASDGTSQWITSEESRAKVQELRVGVGAILTGTGTVLKDNPQLTVRGAKRQPLAAVIGARPIPKDFHVAARALVYSDIDHALGSLWDEFKVHRVLVEAGPGLTGSLWSAGVIDEVWWFQAPVLMGTGMSAVGDIGVKTLAQALRFSELEVNRVGLDLMVHFSTHDVTPN